MFNNMTETNNSNTNNNTTIKNQNYNKLVKDLVERFKIASNIHDPKTLGSLLIEYAEWTDVIGHTKLGRKEIENQHHYPFTTVLKDAELDVKFFRSKLLDDDKIKLCLLILNENQMVIERLTENQYLVSDRVFLINFIAITVIEKDRVLLKIVLAHNNDYTSTILKRIVNK